MSRFYFCLGWGLSAFWLPSLAFAQTTRPIEFNRDVRPILSDACFQCHGPDKAKRKASLHFDAKEGAGEVIVPGKPEESELIKRITSAEPKRRMPPPSAAHTLSAKQIDTLREWIKQGAHWQKHWAFIPPSRPLLPAVRNKAWAKSGIDHFVLARLEAEGLAVSPEADPVTLIRRMTLDLTGLPPTVKEVGDFVAAWDGASAKRQAVVEQLADRLLASPRHGERMAMPWLNAARYADTNGYQTDGERVMWRWRDWVIEAFNSNMPFDQFTIEQIAGDMLPRATLEQKIATGFNRNHRGNSEGGVIPEEYAVEYVVDRVDTTSTVWLGLTAGCARCHDHKYDPLSQKEFYQLFAYFNNVPERGKAIKYGNSPPYIKTPSRAQQVQWKQLEAQVLAATEAWNKLQPALNREQAAWESQRLAKATPQIGEITWHFRRGLQTQFYSSATGGDLQMIPGGIPWSVPLPGRAGGFSLDGRSGLRAASLDVGAFGFFDKFTIGTWIKVAPGEGGAMLSRMVDTDRADGYNFVLEKGKLHVHLVKRWLDDAIRVETVEALTANQWHHVMFSYDGSRLAAGVKIHVDGVLQKLKVNLDDLNQSFNTKEPFRIGAGAGSRFKGVIGNVTIFNQVLPPEDVALVANTDSIGDIVTTPAAKRTSAQAHKLRTYYLETQASAGIKQARQQLEHARKEMERFDESIPTTMVMQEMPTPRATHLLIRGEYDKPGIRVFPTLPTALPALPKGAPNNRLGLGHWLVAKDNPLTARVAVNRYWQMLFGAGLVRSVEDFGAQGDWPSHPELLDWLAVEFMESISPERKLGDRPIPGLAPGAGSWDIKRLLKLIVTSATYRQSSRVTPQLLLRDPNNRLLARGPRFRLSADVMRDQALFASGLLVEKLGGPSVKPYQPAGLVMELTGMEEYEQDHGEKLYRRSLYTFWKRTVPPPAMMNFDAANRETCVVRETRTNTPLQALNLMNDVTYVEAARVMAERIMKKETDPASRFALAWRLATARSPRPAELQILRDAFAQHHAHYEKDRAAALKLVSTGEHPRDAKLDIAEHAAYAAVCNMILNLDEVITKE